MSQTHQSEGVRLVMSSYYFFNPSLLSAHCLSFANAGGPEWSAMELQTKSIKNNIVLTTTEYNSFWLPDLCGLVNDVESPWLAKWSVRLRHTHPEWIDFLRYSIIEPTLLVKVLEILSRCRISESEGVELVRTRARSIVEKVERKLAMDRNNARLETNKESEKRSSRG